MKVVEINEENLEEFEADIDEDIAESIGRKYYKAMGLTGDEDEILGTLIWENKDLSEAKKKQAELMWFSLKDGNDGEKLFKAFKKSAKSEDVVKSSFEFVKPSETVTTALFSQDFDMKKKESRDIYTTVGEVSGLSFAKKKPPAYVVGLYDLTVRQYKQGVIACLYRNRKGMMEDLAVMPMGWYDQDISCAVRTDGEVTGLFLVHQYPSGVLAPVLLYAAGPNSKMDVLNMLRFAVRSAAAECSPDTKILIRRHNESVKALSDKLFPGVKGEPALFGERDE